MSDDREDDETDWDKEEREREEERAVRLAKRAMLEATREIEDRRRKEMEASQADLRAKLCADGVAVTGYIDMWAVRRQALAQEIFTEIITDNAKDLMVSIGSSAEQDMRQWVRDAYERSHQVAGWAMEVMKEHEESLRARQKPGKKI